MIKYNGDLVDSLLISEAWKEIAFPLLQESIASVSGRFTNGRFYQGTLTKSKMNRDELAGYQMALEEFYNRLSDFVIERDRLKSKKKEEDLERKAPMVNPFLEDAYDTED